MLLVQTAILLWLTVLVLRFAARRHQVMTQFMDLMTFMKQAQDVMNERARDLKARQEEFD